MKVFLIVGLALPLFAPAGALAQSTGPGEELLGMDHRHGDGLSVTEVPEME